MTSVLMSAGLYKYTFCFIKVMLYYLEYRYA